MGAHTKSQQKWDKFFWNICFYKCILINNVSNASVIHQTYFDSFRHSLANSLERALAPAMAAVISFIDVRQNLVILSRPFDHTSSNLTSLWLQIFEQAHKLGLKFSHIITENFNTNQAVCNSFTSSFWL